MSPHGLVALVTPERVVRQLADDLAFPNGMAITADGATLIVAESHGNRLTAYNIVQDGDLENRRTWADTGAITPMGSVSTPTAPSGTPTWPIANACECGRAARRSRQSNWTEEPSPARSSRGNQPKLYVVGQEYGGPQATEPTGQMFVFPAPASGAGKP